MNLSKKFSAKLAGNLEVLFSMFCARFEAGLPYPLIE